MKRILFMLTLAIALGASATEQANAITPADSTAKKKVETKTAVKATKANPANTNSDSVYIPGYTDTSDTGVTVESESSDTLYADSDHSYTFDSDDFDMGSDFFKGIGHAAGAAVAMSIFMLVFSLGLPIFIILIILYFRNKNRRERYRLAEKFIASGQPLPDDFFKERMNQDTQSKGIKNICLGIGLFIFLWALTNSFALGCIGLLVMFTGIGQYLVARNERSNDRKR